MHHIPRTRIRAKNKKERTSTKDAYDNAAPFIEHFDQFSPPYLFLRRKIHLTRRLGCASFLFWMYAVRFTPRLYDDIGPAIYCNNLQSLHIYNTRTHGTHTHTIHSNIIYYNIIFIILPVAMRVRYFLYSRGQQYYLCGPQNVCVLCVYYYCYYIYIWR